MAESNPAAATATGPMVLAAIEHRESPAQRLVDDDLAERFLPSAARWLVATMRWKALRRLFVRAVNSAGPGLWTNLACRKRYIDEKLDAALADIDAVVVLGAGIDTRAYRLARRSDIPVFEVDQPVNIARKQQVVRNAVGAQPDSVHLVPVDFELDDLSAALVAQGYRSDARTFFVWEGVTQYLTAEAVRSTMGYLGTAASGSRLVFTYVRREFIDGTDLYGAKILYRRYVVRRPIWKFGLHPDDVAGFLEGYGWKLVEQAGPDYLLEHYVRPTGRHLGASQLEWSAYAEKL